MWVKGETIETGDRPCEDRYEALKLYFQENNITKGKVLDLGANMGYFSFRLATDFPELEIVMIDYEPHLPRLLLENELDNVSLIHKYMELDEIESHLNDNDYDVILAMSILHHFQEPERLIDILNKFNIVVYEIDFRESVPISNPHLVTRIYDKVMSLNPMLLYKDFRPIYIVDTLYLNGTVHVGVQEARRTFEAIDDDYLEEFFDEDIYYGTLNIKLDEKITFTNHRCLSGVYRIYPMELFGFKVHCIRPLIVDYPTDEVELVSSKHLRTKFVLVDDSRVKLSIDKRFVSIA